MSDVSTDVSLKRNKYGDWQKCSDRTCPRCSLKDIQYRSWESYDEAYTDYNFQCQTCGYQWWIDGIDS